MNNLLAISGKQGSGKDTVGKMIQYLDWKNNIEKGACKSLHYTIEDFLKGNISFVTDWQIKKFADKLKDMVSILIGCTRGQLEDQEFKETFLEKEWDKWIISVDTDAKDLVCTSEENAIKFSKTYGIRLHQKHNPKVTKIEMTPRKLLQLLGTDCGRDIIHPNLWINALFADYYPYPIRNSTNCLSKWIITDMRFPNELKAVKDRGGITIRVNRPNPKGIVDDFINSEQNLHPSETSLDDAIFDVVIENNGPINDLLEKVTEVYNKYVA